MAKGDATRDPNLHLTPVPSVLGGEVLRNTKVHNDAVIDPLDSGTPSSVIDDVNAAVLHEYPEALGWELGTVLYPNGYGYEGPLTVTLPRGGSAELEVEELGLDMGELTFEQQAGRGSLVHDLAAYKTGVRIPPHDLTGLAVDEAWREDFAGDLRKVFPGVRSVTLYAEEFENGFFFSTSASGVNLSGTNDDDIDLSAFTDHIDTASAEFGDIGPDSEMTIDLVETGADPATTPFDITALTEDELDELEDLANNADTAIAALTSVLSDLSVEQRADFGFTDNGLEPGSDATLNASSDIIDQFTPFQRSDFGDLISARLWADRSAARAGA